MVPGTEAYTQVEVLRCSCRVVEFGWRECITAGGRAAESGTGGA